MRCMRAWVNLDLKERAASEIMEYTGHGQTTDIRLPALVYYEFWAQLKIHTKQ